MAKYFRPHGRKSHHTFHKISKREEGKIHIVLAKGLRDSEPRGKRPSQRKEGVRGGGTEIYKLREAGRRCKEEKEKRKIFVLKPGGLIAQDKTAAVA